LKTLFCVFLAMSLSLGATLGCDVKHSGGNAVAASVDGRNIYYADLEKYYQNQAAGSERQPVGEQATVLRLQILSTLIDNELVMRQAEKQGLLATDEEVDRKLNEIKSPFTKEQFDARLKERKLTLDDFRHDLRQSLTVEKVLNKEVTSKITISDQDITNYYNAHRAEFNLVEPQYHLAQIFVTTVPNPQVHNLKNDKAQNEPEARRKAQMLENRLDSGDDFGNLAMGYSEDPETSGNGGDLGFAPESSLKNTDPATREMVMRLKPTQYSPVVAIVNPNSGQVVAFRIIKLIAKEPAGQRDLKDPRVQETIRAQLRDHREQLLKLAYYEVLRDQARVENNYAQRVLAQEGVAQ